MAIITKQEKIEVLEEIMEHIEAIREGLESLDDNRLNAYHLANFQGTESGWLGGPFLVDEIKRETAELKAQVEDEDQD